MEKKMGLALAVWILAILSGTAFFTGPDETTGETAEAIGETVEGNVHKAETPGETWEAAETADATYEAAESAVQIPEVPEKWEEPEKWFTSRMIEEGDEIYNRIIGKTYVENDDIALSDLRYLTLLYVDFGGKTQVGEMIVNQIVADKVLWIFEELYRLRYPIRQIRLIDDYWDTDGNTTDVHSIRADNTSAFNYRTVAGTEILSNHALGLAIDLNPYENPYVKVLPDGSYLITELDFYELSYLYHRENRPYAITHDDSAYQLFTASGFTWGGDWDSPLDYQHFEYVIQ